MPTPRDYYLTTGEPWRSVRSWAVPRILRAMHSALMCTLRISTSGFQHSRALWEEPPGNGVLFVLWHDVTLMPLHLLRERNIGVMMSHSRSGQLQAAFWTLYGWPTVWGSTKKREGIRALREVLRLLRAGQSFGFTPDGPKGPRHRAQPGVIFLASHAPTKVLPMGVAAHSAWRLPTWDRHLIPKPFTHVHMHIGEPLEIPSDIPREELPHWQRFVENAIAQAEAVARQKVAG